MAYGVFILFVTIIGADGQAQQVQESVRFRHLVECERAANDLMQDSPGVTAKCVFQSTPRTDLPFRGYRYRHPVPTIPWGYPYWRRYRYPYWRRRFCHSHWSRPYWHCHRRYYW